MVTVNNQTTFRRVFSSLGGLPRNFHIRFLSWSSSLSASFSNPELVHILLPGEQELEERFLLEAARLKNAEQAQVLTGSGVEEFSQSKVHGVHFSHGRNCLGLSDRYDAINREIPSVEGMSAWIPIEDKVSAKTLYRHSIKENPDGL